MQSRRERADRIESAVNCTVALVREHYGEPLVLATIADDLAISIFSLSRAFKRAMHVSFRTYLLHVRITTAQTLLRETDRPITEIAQLVGFGDLPRFDKMFKQLVGTSPSRFRTRARPAEETFDRSARNYYPPSGRG